MGKDLGVLVDSRNPFFGCEIRLKTVFLVLEARSLEVLIRKLKAAIFTITYTIQTREVC